MNAPDRAQQPRYRYLMSRHLEWLSSKVLLGGYRGRIKGYMSEDTDKYMVQRNKNGGKAEKECNWDGEENQWI